MWKGHQKGELKTVMDSLLVKSLSIRLQHLKMSKFEVHERRAAVFATPDSPCTLTDGGI